MKSFYIRATFYDKFGKRDVAQILDWNNRESVREFAGLADTIIRAGGAVHTKAVDWRIFKRFAEWLRDRDIEGHISFTDWPEAAVFSHSVLSLNKCEPEHVMKLANLMNDWCHDEVTKMFPQWDIAFAFRMEVLGE